MSYDFNFFYEFGQLILNAGDYLYGFLTSDMIYIFSNVLVGCMYVVSGLVSIATFGQIDFFDMTTAASNYIADVQGTMVGTVLGFVGFFVLSLGAFFVYKFIRFLVPFF